MGINAVKRVSFVEAAYCGLGAQGHVECMKRHGDFWDQRVSWVLDRQSSDLFPLWDSSEHFPCLSWGPLWEIGNRGDHRYFISWSSSQVRDTLIDENPKIRLF
jgi:hypothetical protein